MKIHSYESLDSTSTEAARLIDANEALPFAVIAAQQTQGRGRSGRSWESPQGGLYLTLVLPPHLHPDIQHPGSLPLWVAAHTAAFFKEKFSIRVTIKWPNDLLFAGRKLAGILCEGRMQGKELSSLIIGIGINLHEAPKVTEQESVSLEQILGHGLGCDARTLGQELAERLCERSGPQAWQALYEQYSIENGQLYTDGNARLSLYGVNDEGALQLVDLASQELKTLNSVSHGYRWIHQSQGGMLVADIGNSLVKIGYFKNAKERGAEVLKLDLRDEHHPQAIDEFFAKFPQSRPSIIHGITVASRPWEILSKSLRAHGLSLVPVPKRSIRVDYRNYNFDHLGIDRVSIAEAARAFYPNTPLLVVSAGTCITVEAIDAKGLYLGGYILPGLQTKLNSLHLRTDRLPLLKIYEESIVNLPLFGHNTKEAMISGILHESIGLVSFVRSKMPPETKVVLTGGDGQLLNSILHEEWSEGLTLEGIRLMAKGGSVC